MKKVLLLAGVQSQLWQQAEVSTAPIFQVPDHVPTRLLGANIVSATTHVSAEQVLSQGVLLTKLNWVRKLIP